LFEYFNTAYDVVHITLPMTMMLKVGTKERRARIEKRGHVCGASGPSGRGKTAVAVAETARGMAPTAEIWLTVGDLKQ
jgi:hypothetical protein